jgi:hypothetical protein
MSDRFLASLRRNKDVVDAFVIGSSLDETGFSDTDVIILLKDVSRRKSIGYKYDRHRLLYSMLSKDVLQHHDFVFEGSRSECSLPLFLWRSECENDFNEVRKNSFLASHVCGLKDLLQSECNDDYSLKLVVASVLLLPLRILNSKGVYCSKKESFNLVKELPEYENISGIVETCEYIRSKWKRPKPKSIHKLALLIWPSYRVNLFFSFLYIINYKSFKLELEIIRNEIEHLRI